MVTIRIVASLILSLVLITGATAQTRSDSQPRQSTRKDAQTSTSSKKEKEKNHKETQPPQEVPQTKPIGIVWPPGVINPPDRPLSPGYVHVPPPVPEPAMNETQARGSRRREGRVREVQLDGCLDNPAGAGYNFAEERIVSCEDSTVDIYLSYAVNEGYAFLVPQDTDIKDIGPHESVRDVKRFKPDDWAFNHALPLTAGHAYVVWTYGGDFYLVRVNDLRDGHVFLEWRWHSALSRAAAADAEKRAAEKKTLGPYFGK